MAETRALITAVQPLAGYPTNLVARLLYGCGLRVSEPLNLRVKDVCFDDGKLFIMGGKGRKDRVVALPCSVAEDLRSQLEFARAVWKRDGEAKIPLEIPNQLGVKYPEYRFSWQWAWVFPAHWPCKNPRTGELVRYRMHEANVQRAIREARRKIGVMVLPHELRHAYATHSGSRGEHQGFAGSDGPQANRNHHRLLPRRRVECAKSLVKFCCSGFSPAFLLNSTAWASRRRGRGR